MNSEKNTSGNHRKKLKTVLSIVLPVLVLIGVAAYLVFYLTNHSPLVLTDDSFYKQALVSNGQSASFAIHDIFGLYVGLLHVVFLIFGNTPFAGIVLQIALFFICLLLLYIGVQAFIGFIPAAVSMAVFGFLPISLQYVFSLTPELFFFTFCLLGFCFTGIVYRAFRRKRAHSASQQVEGKVDMGNPKVDMGNPKVDKDNQKDTEKKEQENPAPGEPLHNPLPVPKKKSRPAMDFGYQVKEEDMKFDIEVKDGDDFDR